jgi:uncharacterized protein
MPLLVDGHNLIGQLREVQLSDPDDEAKLVLLLRRYATRRRGGRVVVVFDRGTYGHPDNLNGYGVECVFARSPRDADRELIRRIRAIQRTGDWQLVSSDRSVVGEARARKIIVISAQDFARRLERLHEPRASLREKRNDRPLSRQEIEEWLRLFGISDEEASAEGEWPPPGYES